jgi:hypothetical protein
MLEYLDTIIAFVIVMLGFSLLIMLFNQMVSAFLGLRGANLLWGLETMLTTLDPKLKDHAEDIARRVLRDPIVSDSIFNRLEIRVPVIHGLLERWKLASAIGPEAFIRGLSVVAAEIRTENPDVATTVETLMNKVDPATERKLRMIKEAFAQLQPPPGFSVQVDDYMKRLGNSAQQSVGQLESWFNVTMNRVAQRFTMKIRIVTVVAAFLLAFGIHLDTFALTNQLLGNPAIRQQAVAQSTAMLDEAQAILGEQAAGQPISATSQQTTSPQVLKAAVEQLLAKNINKDTEAQPGRFDTVPEFNSVAEAEKWIADNLKPDVKPERKQQLLSAYQRYVITGLKDKATDVGKVLQQTGLELVPGNRKLADLRNPIKFFFCFDGTKNFLGVLLSAGLLALGAPFWYNALKTLTSLRPQVATKHDQQRQEAAAS